MSHGSETPIGRRAFLGGAAAVAVTVPAMATRALAQAPDSPPGALPMIVRENEPRNLESPFSSLDGFVTPVERFYVRSHFPVPEVAAAAWRLSVEGAVERPFSIGLEEFRALPTRTVPALLECAGNGRVMLVPKPKGLLWENGAVGNAEWVGVPLSALLDRAGVRAGAVEVILEGADRGKTEESPGEISYARSLPLEKARRDVLLATRMNGADLTAEHGFPVRAVVPGWYGMASVKWLTRVLVADRPFGGYFQTLEYSTFDRAGGLPTLVPLTGNAVKAQVARPGRLEVVAAGKPYRVHGAAWAGEAEVVKVELSVDGGKTWSPATLLGEAVPHCWRLWEWSWAVPNAPGRQRLMARATDSQGRTQPMARSTDLRNVMIHHVIPVEVDVA